MYVNLFVLPKNDRRTTNEPGATVDRNPLSQTERLERILRNLENRRNATYIERPKTVNAEIRWLG